MSSTIQKCLAVVVITAFACSAAADELRGTVVAIADGDTLTVLDAAKEQHKIRLEGIDAPEKKQAYGAKSGAALGAKVFKRDVRVEWQKKDRYGRILGQVYLGDRWINEELVSEGWAWHFKRYSSDEKLAQAEIRARTAGAGLWKDKVPTPPWEFRAARKSGAIR